MSLYDDDRPMIWRELAKDLTPLPKIKKPKPVTSSDLEPIKGKS